MVPNDTTVVCRPRPCALTPLSPLFRSNAENIDALQRRVIRLEVEVQMMTSETEQSDETAVRLEAAREQLDALKTELLTLQSKWQEDKAVVAAYRETHKALETHRRGLEVAERDRDFETVWTRPSQKGRGGRGVWGRVYPRIISVLFRGVVVLDCKRRCST